MRLYKETNTFETITLSQINPNISYIQSLCLQKKENPIIKALRKHNYPGCKKENPVEKNKASPITHTLKILFCAQLTKTYVLSHQFPDERINIGNGFFEKIYYKIHKHSANFVHFGLN